MLCSVSKSSDHGNTWRWVGVSSFHVRVISTCAVLFVSICLTHMAVWVCVTVSCNNDCFYLLLMLLCSTCTLLIFLVYLGYFKFPSQRLFLIYPIRISFRNGLFTNESRHLGVLVCLVWFFGGFLSSDVKLLKENPRSRSLVLCHGYQL